MKIIQFQDKPLAHYSYAIISNNKMAVVDPARDPKPYYKLAEENNAKIIAVFETHPHADFVSSHLQMHKETSADIYVSKLVGANYPHKTFDDGDSLTMVDITFYAINTPGHSPDGISIVAKDKNSKHALFTGDTLFIGDVGRPDLRETAGNKTAKREELAKAMYHTINNKFNALPDDTIIYPAHGAGSLCGKNMSSDSYSTLGTERRTNWAFKSMSEESFVNHILEDQPFVPAYFGYDVDLNKDGAKNVESEIGQVPFVLRASELDKNIVVIDTRDESDFKKNHIPNSINIMARNENDKIETWLGSIIKPNELFYVVINIVDNRQDILERISKIGYESQIKGILILDDKGLEKSDNLDLETFKKEMKKFTILDIRNKSEYNEGAIFENAINIPLHELREALNEIPKDKPIVVHCAGGYRSAAGSSIVAKEIKETKVYDLSEKVNEFKQ